MIPKLDTEPRLQGQTADLVDWARKVPRSVNLLIESESAQQALNVLLQQMAPTGQFAPFMLTAAPAGWVAGDGGTIGNVGSGATRANADTLPLFTVWWTQFTDAQLPILTSAGGASTRGASAAADWAALKRLTVFDVQGRFTRNSNGGTVIAGTKYAEVLPNHTHDIAFNVVNLAGGGLGITVPVTTTGSVNSGSISGEVRPINIGMLGCFKL